MVDVSIVRWGYKQCTLTGDTTCSICYLTIMSSATIRFLVWVVGLESNPTSNHWREIASICSDTCVHGSRHWHTKKMCGIPCYPRVEYTWCFYDIIERPFHDEGCTLKHWICHRGNDCYPVDFVVYNIPYVQTRPYQRAKLGVYAPWTSTFHLDIRGSKSMDSSFACACSTHPLKIPHVSTGWFHHVWMSNPYLQICTPMIMDPPRTHNGSHLWNHELCVGRCACCGSPPLEMSPDQRSSQRKDLELPGPWTSGVSWAELWTSGSSVLEIWWSKGFERWCKRGSSPISWP